MIQFRKPYFLILAISLLSCSGGGWDGGPTRTATPTLGVAPGVYLAAQTVTITSATAGATIRYTTDGSVPSDNTGLLYTAPVLVSDNTTITAVALKPGMEASRIATGSYSILGVVEVRGGGHHTLLLAADGTVWSMGDNSKGQLGDGTQANNPVPRRIPGLTDVVSIAAGFDSSYALKADGTVWAIGGNEFGQLGDGTTANRSTVGMVQGLAGVRKISAGRYHVLAIRTDNTLWAWGENDEGQLGDNTVVNRHVPVPVQGLDDVADVSASWVHSLAAKNDGTAWEWGYTAYAPIRKRLPVQVVELSNVRSVFTGMSWGSVVARGDGTLWTWGAPYFAPGDDPNFPLTSTIYRPKQAPNVAGASGVAIVYGTGLVRTQGGALLVRARNDFTWSELPGTAGIAVADLRSGWDHYVGLSSDGRVWLWGDGASGQLSSGSLGYVASPTPLRY